MADPIVKTTPEATAVAEIMKASLIPQVVSLADGDVKGDVALFPAGNGTFGSKTVKELLAPYRKAPERIEGTAQFTDLASFIAHVQRFKGDDSAVFACRDPEKPSLTAVYDYHAKGSPKFGKHRAKYAFPLSDEWTAWQEKNSEELEQSAFAEFVEDRIGDVVAPTPELVKGAAADFVSKLGLTYATPSQVLELSRGLELRAGVALKQAVKLSSGEAQFMYVEEHQNADGTPLRVPGAFLLGIPVFKSGDLFQVPARLRYRRQGSGVVWIYELYRTDKIFDVAFDEALSEVKDETALTLFLGSPE